MAKQQPDSPDQIVSSLIDRWCDRRELKALRCILQGWPHRDDRWRAQASGCPGKVRAFATLTDDERADVQAAIWAYEHALKGRTG